MEETILQASIPSTTELCCVVAEIDLTEVHDSSVKSHFHWKTLKCRLMLDKMGDWLIACPLYQTLGSIHVVTSVEFFKNQLFQQNLREMNIAWSSPRPVTPDVYANCLRYSILFAIAPRWNKIGQYLIAGKYFLTETASVTATKFKLNLDTTSQTNTSAIVKIQPVKIEQSYLTLEDIDIPNEVVIHFWADPRGAIDFTYYGDYRVIVLPSLKKGKLIAAHKTIPASSPFKNYDQLRRHWKNMYGYRLPLSDTGIMYYEVYFTNPNSHSFLYPHICVRSRFEETSYPGNRKVPVENLLRDTNDAVTMICGRTFKMINIGDCNIGNSTIISDHCRQRRPTLEMTPQRRSDERDLGGNFDDTARLSFSACRTPNNQQQQQQHRRPDFSPSMSPTPSLRGNYSNKEKPMDTLPGNLISTGRVCNTKSTAQRYTRTNDYWYRSGSQNCCPNVADKERRERSKITPTFGLSKYRDSLSSRVRNVKPKIENKEIVSRYFDAGEGGSDGATTSRLTVDHHKMIERGNNFTLLQKLRHNIKPKNEPVNDYFQQME